MYDSLIILRALGALLGFLISLAWFIRFRQHLVRRNEFLLVTLLGMTLLIVALFPASVNIIAELMALGDREFGRLITLLIIANFLTLFFLLGLRIKNGRLSIQFDLLIRKLALEKFKHESGLKKIKKIMVIIPALNEAENLKELLRNFPRQIKGRPLGVLVVDDGSSDDTVDVVRKAGHLVISNPINRGGGAALRLGYDLAAEGGTEIVVTMDGDGQHLPGDIAALVEPILTEHSEMVIGSRLLGRHERSSFLRGVGLYIFNFIINLLAGTRITDCSSGFRAFRVSALRQILFIQDQFHTAELIIEAASKGIKIGEVPVTIKKRLSGSSKKGADLNYGYNFLKTILSTWLRR